jgi:hypothetical protein
MGLDLTLLPAYSVRSTDFSQEVLTLEREGNDFNDQLRIESSTSQIIAPKEFTSYKGETKSGEHCYGLTLTDKYDSRIKGVRADWLTEFFAKFEWNNPRNRAAMAYIKELYPDNIVYLYFC